MALVTLQTPPLTSEQKQRIGERILQALHAEGVPASQTVVLFQPESSDLYLEGGLLVIVVLFLFLAELRTAVIVVLSLPVTFMFSFLLMGASG